MLDSGVQFGPWQPLESARVDAPEHPGVWQTKQRLLIDYPLGKSAMLQYGVASESLREGLGEAHAEPGIMARYVVCAKPSAEWLCNQLLTHFRARFGALPKWNQTEPE